MHVVVANLTNGGLSGGSRKYLQRVLPRLAQDPRITRLDVYVPEAIQSELARHLSLPIATWPAGDHRQGFRGLAADLTARRPEVVFIPGARTLPLTAAIPQVIMFRNMEPPTFPFWKNAWRESVRNLARNWQARRACRRAARIIAVSRYVARFLCARWHLPARQVSHIYHGADPVQSPALNTWPRPINESRPAVPDFSGRRFLFTAGSLRPARGLEDIVQALGLTATRTSDCTLAIAGGVDPGMQWYVDRLRSLAAKLGVSDRVAWLGPLGPAEMSAHFHHCETFVMTSRAEACPNTALEALAHGCSIVSTSTAPMPEFFGPQAHYYRAGDAHSLADALVRRRLVPLERTLERQAAQARAAEFSWQRTAAETADVLAEVAGAAQTGRGRRAA